MPSLLPNFEYDIFISYRHNDNLPTDQAGLDGWVTDFVQNLEKELRSTLKDSLTIYFDKNPHDGLLETHNVDKSLEGKLKCLIFIPIISQTYCDPKSFAWQHEFVAFNKLVKKDQFGRDIKLGNGNVASRILPIKIHELDAEDKTTIENEIGGVLRPIEFIYKESGVNRPLKPSDNKTDNQNKTDYRNQINKVAHAIKEIILSFRNPSAQSPPASRQLAAKSSILKPVVVLVSMLLIALTYFLYSQVDSEIQPLETIDKSIAVLPFVNMSADPEQEYFSDGLSEELLNLLAKLPELRVVGRTSSFSFKGKNEDLRGIGEKLGVAYLLEGSVRKSGNKLRITSQLINVQSGSHVWSETYDRQLSEIFSVQDEIAAQVVEQLKIKIGVVNNSKSKNLETYNLLLESRFVGAQRLPGFHLKTRALMEKAVRIDSTDAGLWAGLAVAIIAAPHQNSLQRKHSYELAVKAARRAVELDPGLPEAHTALASIMLFYYWDWASAEAEYNAASKLDPRFTGAAISLNIILGRFDVALMEALERLKDDPLNPDSWLNAGGAYQRLGETTRAIEHYQKLVELTPFSDDAHAQLATALAEGELMDEALLELGKITDKSSPRFLSLNARIHYYLGDKQKAANYLTDLIESDEKPVDNSFAIAQLFSQQGKNQEAMGWLNTAYDRRNPTLCYAYSVTSRPLGKNKKWYPSLFELRHDPKFKELLRKMNLPDTFEN